jgi:hypothetical protein
MMTPRHTITKFEALDLMLESCIKDQSSHERRNQHLTAIRGILDNWIRDFRHYQQEEDREAKALTTLEAIYALCIWQLEHETHVEVKTRLFMARNLITRFLQNRDKALRDGIDKRSRQILQSRKETAELSETAESAFNHPLPDFENMDVSHPDLDSSGEGPENDWETMP